MALLTYLPQWYQVNCNWHPRCDIVGYDDAIRGINELTAYFQHKGELLHLWTFKEKLHLAEVRGMFDKMSLIGLFAVVVIFLAFDKKRVSRYASINAIIILCLLIVLPFFGSFWRDVFHPLLFNNDLWKNNQYDLSYYIMPRVFFKYTAALIIFLCCFINLTIWLIFRQKSKEKIS